MSSAAASWADLTAAVSVPADITEVITFAPAPPTPPQGPTDSDRVLAELHRLPQRPAPGVVPLCHPEPGLLPMRKTVTANFPAEDTLQE